eukprot:6194887-Pleurochrysis_carterae.AAC.2
MALYSDIAFISLVSRYVLGGRKRILLILLYEPGKQIPLGSSYIGQLPRCVRKRNDSPVVSLVRPLACSV